MKMSVIGCGYLGAVHAACMVELGHEVIGIDVDQPKVDALNAGTPPFFEPGFDEILSKNPDRLRFSTTMADVAEATVHFITVGTPQTADGAVDMRYVDQAVTALLPFLKPGDLVVGKSTVPVGTAARLRELVRPTGADLMWNPEFLREGFAVSDTLSPDRLVYGVHEGDESLVETLDAVFQPLLERGTPRLVMNLETAELVKVAANSFLATKISFINAMAEIADVVGADVTLLADAIGHDERIGRRFLNAGIGFGGGCLPKDIRGFVRRAEELGVGHSVSFLGDVDAINLRRRKRVIEVLDEELGGLQGRTIGLWGLAFKPNSDDIRDSPALDIAESLARAGATVQAFDPEAMGPASRRVRDNGLESSIIFAESLQDALDGAEALVVATEWSVFTSADPQALNPHTNARLVVDGRNCLPATAWKEAGWRYIGMGRR